MLHPWIAKYLIYYPIVFLKGEFIPFYLSSYKGFQYLPFDEIEKLQFERLKNIVDYAIKNSPYYRRRIFDVGVGSSKDLSSISDFKRIPPFTKSEFIQNKAQFYTWHSLWSGTKTTGGSTGHPVQIKKNPDALARERVATWRSYGWAGVDIGDVQARFWGVPHSPVGRFKMKITDAISNRVRVSAFDLDAESLTKHFGYLQKIKPVYLYGYVSAISLLAEHIILNRLAKISGLKAVITTSEILTDVIRERIQVAFGCPVFNEYGCGEVGSIAHECEFGNMHVMADNLYIEVDSDTGEGELLVTDFYNLATPLIRYQLGDYATISSSVCKCGRGLPVLAGIHGRAYDLIRTRDGRVIHPESVIYVFESLQSETGAIGQFQVVQLSVEDILVYIVPTCNWSAGVEVELNRRLLICLGARINISFKLCDSIHREASGKMRLVKSNV